MAGIVVCEMVWVLESCYRFRRDEIVPVLRSLLRARDLHFQSPDMVARALERYQAGPGDLADYLTDEIGRAHGCEATATFDGALVPDAGFVAP